jgi:predicted TIM-barrel fold metal-dependent hydrolase
MKEEYSLKIDSYAHIVPPKYKDFLYKIAPEQVDTKINNNPSLYDLEYRFKLMDPHEPLRQVLTLAWPPLEEVAGPEKTPELAEVANDEMAELVARYPERFITAIAVLPINNIDASLKEAERAVKDLKLRGVYIHTPVCDRPLDLPEFFPLYEMMSRYDLPIFIHPMRLIDYPDYRTENESKYNMQGTFGWPYETTAFMARLVFGGIMEKYPGLKIVTHHCGGMVPFFADRIEELSHLWKRGLARSGGESPMLTRSIIDYFKLFYADTALYGNPSALMCGYHFFKADHLLFGADFPLGDTEKGARNLRKTVNAIERMDITEAERRQIYEDNARKLMRLPS